MENRIIPPPQASARQPEMGDRFNRTLFLALDSLQEGQIPYALIGGIAASGMGRPRSTHDIDVFVRPEDAEAALDALARKGFETERTDERWLFKGWMEDMMVDIIFKSSGDIYFDNEMQKHTRNVHYHGRDIPAVNPVDLVIIKAAVHSEIGPHHWADALAILSHAQLDWDYLLKRSRKAARRLLALLIYAQSNDIWIPNNVIHELFSVVFGQPPAQSTHSGHFTDVPVGRTASGPAAGPHQQEDGFRQNLQSREQNSAMKTSVGQAPPAPHPNEAYLLPHIQEALATDARTAAADIQITVGGKKVLVKGEVSNPNARRAVEDVIKDVAVGYAIDNQVRITELTPPETQEVL